LDDTCDDLSTTATSAAFATSATFAAATFNFNFQKRAHGVANDNTGEPLIGRTSGQA
jgi:hypothetical protein